MLPQPLRVAVLSETPRTAVGHGVHSAFVDMVGAFRRRADINVFENPSQGQFDIVHVHTVGLTARRLLKRFRKSGAKIVISAHVVPDSLRDSLAATDLWLPAFSWYLKRFYRQADALVAVSPYVREQLNAFGVRTRVEVIPNGVDRRFFHPDAADRSRVRAEWHLPDDAFVVIASGQLQPRKGIAEFVAVARLVPQARFVWVGGRPFGLATEGYAEIDKLIAQAPANCLFPGLQRYEVMPAWYASADLFWLPSRQETFGLAVTEAAACGLPLLLRDLPVYRDLFRPAYASADAIEDCAAHIHRFRDDTAYANMMRMQAEALASRYDLDVIAERYVLLYRDLLARSFPVS